MSVAPPRNPQGSHKKPLFALSPGQLSPTGNGSSLQTSPTTASASASAADNHTILSSSSNGSHENTNETNSSSVPLEKTQSFVNLTSSSLQGLFGSQTSLAELAGDVPSPRPGGGSFGSYRNTASYTHGSDVNGQPNFSRFDGTSFSSTTNNSTASSRPFSQDNNSTTTDSTFISSANTTTRKLDSNTRGDIGNNTNNAGRDGGGGRGGSSSTKQEIDLNEANFLLTHPKPARRRPSSFSVGGNSTAQKKSLLLKYKSQLQQQREFFSFSLLAPDGTIVKFTKFEILIRFVALFVFGVAYGQLAKNLHDNQQVSSQILNIDRFPIFFSLIWGFHAVVLGTLLPLIDRAHPEGSIKPATLSTLSSAASSETPSRPTSVDSAAAAATAEEEKQQQEQKGGSDWVSIIRASAAFLGLAYGVRKLPWESSSQVAFLWGCINPILWYLLDGTRNGFIVSSVTAIVETVGFAFFIPSHLPPADFSSVYISVVVWVASVLFCCSICFGNLGRRILTNM